MPHRIPWTPRHTEALGVLMVAICVAAVWWPGALGVGGVYLVYLASKRGGNE